MNAGTKHLTPRAICISVLTVTALSAGRTDNRIVLSQQKAPEIMVSVAITSKEGSPVSDVSKTSFQIFEDKSPLEITSFGNQNSPSSVAIVFDLSGSVGGLIGPKPRQKLISAIENITSLIDSGNTLNEYFIIAFSNDHQLLASGGREDAKRGISRLRSLTLSGQSELFDTCRFAIDQVDQGKHRKKAVILISDGVDTYSRLTLEDVRRSLKETGVVIYALDIGDQQDLPYGVTARGPKTLEKLADESGGLTFHPKKVDQIVLAIERISENLNTRYLVGLKPTKILERGQCVSFKVTLKPPTDPSGKAQRLTVQSRENHCSRLR